MATGRVGIRQNVNLLYETDAQAFITAAALTDSTQKTAVNTLVIDLKGAGLWTKMKAIYPFVGGTALSHQWNLKDSRDLNAAFRLTFNGGWTHTSTGARPNGSTGYADTYLTPFANLNQNDNHYTIYSRTNSTTNAQMWDIAVASSNSNWSNYHGHNQNYSGGGYGSGVSSFNNSNHTSYYSQNGAQDMSGVTNGLIGNSRLSSSQYSLYRNGNYLQWYNSWWRDTLYNIASMAPSTNPFKIGVIGSPGTTYPTNYYGFSNREYAFATIGDGLTTAEMKLLYRIIEKFQVALGRNVNTVLPFYYNGNYSLEVNNFIINAGITDSTQQSALNTLVNALKTANIWAKMKAVYPMVGGTATAHKFNLVNPVDTDAAFRLVFNGGWTHSATGALPNGSNAYADTFLIPSTSLILNNSHLSFYSRATVNSPGNSMDIGCTWQNSNQTQIYLHYHSNGRALDNNALSSLTCSEANRVVVSQTNPKGLMISSRISTSSLTLYQNGLVKGSNTNINTSTYNGLPQNATTIGAIRQYNGSTTLYSFYSTKECAFASIGDGLTDAEATTFYNAVQAFQTTLNRQV